ncbi:unnamed protein product [Closterium sp. NIES-53]
MLESHDTQHRIQARPTITSKATTTHWQGNNNALATAIPNIAYRHGRLDGVLPLAALQPARRPCSPLAARLQPARHPFAARSPPVCSPLAARLRPARRPLQPAHRLLAARSPTLCNLLAPPCLRRPAAARATAAAGGGSAGSAGSAAGAGGAGRATGSAGGAAGAGGARPTTDRCWVQIHIARHPTVCLYSRNVHFDTTLYAL